MFTYFRSNFNGFPCTAQTGKFIAQFPRLKYLTLLGIPETFNFYDFCEIFKNGYIASMLLSFSFHTSMDYQNNFKAAVDKIKNDWNSETDFPEVDFCNM